MLTARRLAAALTIVGTGVLAYALPVSASSAHPAHEGGECVDGTHRDNLIAHIEAETGVGTVTGKAPLCEPVDIMFSIYKVPDTWQGPGFNGTAVPQHLIESDSGTVAGDATLELHVTVPACGNVQADLYYPPEITDVDVNGTGPRLIAGYIWQITPPDKCEKPTTSPPTTTPPPTMTPPPSTTPPPTSPPPTTPSTTPPTSPSPSTSVPVPTPTTAAPPPIGQPIPLPPVAAPPPPRRQLASTGSNSTAPLVGLGTILLGTGIGLSLIGRRRRTS